MNILSARAMPFSKEAEKTTTNCIFYLISNNKTRNWCVRAFWYIWWYAVKWKRNEFIIRLNSIIVFWLLFVSWMLDILVFLLLILRSKIFPHLNIYCYFHIKWLQLQKKKKMKQCLSSSSSSCYLVKVDTHTHTHEVLICIYTCLSKGLCSCSWNMSQLQLRDSLLPYIFKEITTINEVESFVIIWKL